MAKILSELNVALGGSAKDPANTALMGFAAGLGQAGAPHMLTPVPFGQALSIGEQTSQAYQKQALANAIQQQAILPFMRARTAEAEQAVNGQNNSAVSPMQRAADQALGANLISPGMGATLYNNNPNVVAQRTLAETLNKLSLIPANERAVILAKEFGIPAQGSLPEATTQSPNGSLATMPNAPAAIAANAYNKSGGAAAGSYPMNAALAWHSLAPGHAGATIGAPPAQFVPAPGPAPGAAPAAALQRQVGVMSGLSGAAGAAGRPAPFSALGVGPSGGAPQRTSEGISPPGTAAAERAAGERRLPGVLAQVSGAAGPPGPSRPTVMLPAARGAQGGSGIFAPGTTVAGYQLQKAAAENTIAQEAAGAKEAEAGQAQLARLTEMQQALNRIPVGGNFAKIYEGVGNVLNYAGIKVPGLAAMQEYSKYRTNFVADAARKMGAKVSYQEVNYIARGVPDFTLAGNAPRALLGQLTGASQYDIARNQALKYYATSVPNIYGKAYQGTTRGFEQWWQKTGVTPGIFMFFGTMDALPAAQRGAYYLHFGRNTTGKMYLNQYRKGQAFLKAHPQLVPFLAGQQ
jgi:hypothetical protein